VALSFPGAGLLWEKELALATGTAFHQIFFSFDISKN
jgi:hypothetical protein